MRTDVAGVTYDPKNLIKSESSGMYTVNTTEAFVEFHFIKQVISLYKYKLKSLSGHCSTNGWIIEGSNNGRKYDVISTKNDLLCGSYRCTTNVERFFEVSNHKFYKRIRIMQPFGECEKIGYFFGLAAVDFYGALSVSPIIYSHNCRRFSRPNEFLITILLYS